LLTEPEIHLFLTQLQEGNIDDEKYRQMLVNTLVNKVYVYDNKTTIYFSAAGKEPVEITAELRKKVEGQGKGSYRTLMAEG